MRYSVDCIRDCRENFDGRIPITTPEKAASVFLDAAASPHQETFRVVTLDTKNRPIKNHLVFIGSLNATLVHPRDIFRRAIADNAESILVSHNHPSGDTTPSPDDRVFTKRLADCGALLGFHVMDHIITNARGEFYSLRAESEDNFS